MLPACALAPYSHFHFAYEFITRRLAHVLDSLVRVSGLSLQQGSTTLRCRVARALKRAGSSLRRRRASVLTAFRLGPDYTLSRISFCPPTSSLWTARVAPGGAVALGCGLPIVAS